MSKDIKIFGARATIQLRHEGTIEELGSILSKWLKVPEIYFDTDQDPPHEVFGSCESMGFELNLSHSDVMDDFRFELSIQTSDSFKEIFHGQMHDISFWLARYISKMANIDVAIGNESDSTSILFRDGGILAQ